MASHCPGDRDPLWAPQEVAPAASPGLLRVSLCFRSLLEWGERDPSVPRACLRVGPCAGNTLCHHPQLNFRSQGNPGALTQLHPADGVFLPPGALSVPSACCRGSSEQTLALHLWFLVCLPPSPDCILRRAERTYVFIHSVTQTSHNVENHTES